MGLFSTSVKWGDTVLIECRDECRDELHDLIVAVVQTTDGTRTHKNAEHPYGYGVDHESAVVAIMAASDWNEGYIRKRLIAADNSLAMAIELCGAHAYMHNALVARLLAEELGQKFDKNLREDLRYRDTNVVCREYIWLSRTLKGVRELKKPAAV